MTVIASAEAVASYNFMGWKEDGAAVSGDAEYTFTVSGNRNLVAVFKEVFSYNTGVDWWEIILPSFSNWYRVTYGDGKFVAVAYSSNHAAYSSATGPAV